MTVRDQLAEFAAGLKFDDLPRDVVEFTSMLVRDQIGMTAIAAKIDPDRKLQVDAIGIPGFFKEMGGKEESSLVTQGCRVPCINAAFSNTVLSFGSFDSFHRAAIHLSCLIPATLAVAERQHAGGKDLILATVAGCEVMARVGYALGADNVYSRGFHPTALCAPIGCAVAAGKLLGLGQDALAQAISIAAVQGSGAPPWVQFPKSPFTHRIQSGRASQSGVLAALLAQMGVIGISAIFEDPRGFLRAHSANPDPAKATGGLGTVWEVKQTTCGRFNVGIYIRPGIEALAEILQKHHIQGDDIDRMTLKLPTSVAPVVGSSVYPSVDASGSTNRSARYIMAFTAYKGESGIAFSLDYKSEANLTDPRHVDLFNRTDVVPEPELDKLFPGTWPGIVVLTTKDGREFTHFHNGALKGSPENPLTAQDMEDKFSKVIAPVLPKHRADRMLEMLHRLEELDDVSDLAVLMAAR
ncbi:MAG: MmgE/PrpD family protein [Chloroflexi bacterium]|nr:MmgE/PrpD family protein [Chloroflexota bacterium]